MALRRLALALVATLAAPAVAAAQDVPRPRLQVPAAVAPGGRLVARTSGLAAPVRVFVLRGQRWRPAARVLRAPSEPGILRVRARGADGAATPERRVRVRPLVLAAVGDVNLGDGPGASIDRYGAAYPWPSVGPVLRRADVTFGNLECAVSARGRPEAKRFTFRGRPSALAPMRRLAGFDVVNLANNHAGDYGDRALLDTLAHLRRARIAAVGAGRDEAAAYRPRVIEALGLRIAFVGFSEILPFDFRARGADPGTAWAFPARIRAGVRAARRQADVVVATFHWGIERATSENAHQRALARLALDAGATAVIGAHPHVLQPIRHPRGRLVAYSLGNFVFSASSPTTAATGILHVALARRRVVGVRLLPAVIRGSRPVLR